MEPNTDPVTAYYGLLLDGTASFDPARLRPLLADELVFEGPIAGRVVGADRFVRGVTGFVETMRGMTMLHRLAGDGEAATMYDAELPGGTVRFAEFFRLADGRIAGLRLLYDADRYRAAGGR
ncbi:hypothetical protein Athai_66970 [Actinocatenispora thailandica]|uniref:SnoaL-like domain-containing protein n=1 Tax=Actinocatenispora thailandica TaxID=227318 RepID=A0A7R7DWJ1_9ACTN|nr:nuclear transport factor 2 family protein [Actinocatenispora thailandica]BCJ39194.1 hypothetical protein Athai_66970 [Actinocatenispora thailandica]